MSQAQHEYEVMRELEEQEHARIIKRIDDVLYRRAIATKWPSVLLWPNQKQSPVLFSGNGKGFAPSSEPNHEPTQGTHHGQDQ